MKKRIGLEVVHRRTYRRSRSKYHEDMKKLLNCVVAVSVGMAIQASAGIFYPTYLLNPPIPQASNPTVSDLIAVLEANGLSTDIGSQLYKSDVGPASLFQTTIESSTPPAGGLTATLDYVGGSPVPQLTYIIVKDGNAGWTLWGASNWDGDSDIVVDNRGLWNKPGTALSGISHITIFGKPGTPPPPPPPPGLPDSGSTLALLGFGLIGIEMLRRKLATQ